MKVLDILKTDLDQCVHDAQQEPIVVTREGQPLAMVVGVRGMDLAQIERSRSPEFWSMIQQRRDERTIPWEDVRQELE